LKYQSALFRFLAIVSFLLFTAEAYSQTTVTVTTNAGDESVGSLGWAVTTLNAAGDGSVTFAISNPITLTQPLSAFTNNVTFLGPGNTLIGQDTSQSQFLFQQGLNQQENLNFQNNGAYVAGFDVAVTASSWTMGSGNVTDFNGTNASTITASGGLNVDGSDGGNTSVTVGNWITGSSVYLVGGNGGGVTDTNGSGDQGGAGGSDSVSVASFSMPTGGYLTLVAGKGGSVTDLGTGTNTGGNGGSASAAFGAVSIANFGNLAVNGGNGGDGVTGGNGGSASLTAGSVSLYYDIGVQGGTGANGVSTSGNGGNGFVSMGSYFGTTGSNFQVAGGNGGSPSFGPGGNGGSVVVEGGSVSIITGGSPSPVFKVLGGTGGGGLSGGNGGNAAITLTELSLGSNASFQVVGGNGGYTYSGTIPGNGGLGGNTSLSLGSFSIGVSTTLNISSGSGGTGSVAANTGGTGGNGGAGGALAATFANITMGSGSNLYLNGGGGGNGGGVISGGTGGAGGDGGDVSLSIGAVTMASSNYLSVSGGSGGIGGAAGTNGADGATGQASASIGDLEGAGTVAMAGNAVLQVTQGNYSGSLNGSELFEKTGSGALTLSGSNDYSGGTSVMGGTLAVDTSGTLGTSEVQVGSGALLDYIDSSTAVNVVTVTGGGAIRFQDNSSAALATITLQSGASASFTGSATGGIASFADLAGASLDISGESGGVTIGSLAGGGLVNLGGNALGVGSNSASTTFSGVMAGTGSFTKVGGGILTLSGINTYSGGTTLAVGTLAVGNTQALGTGSAVIGSGTLETAGSPLTFQVGGNYLQGSSGTLQMGLGGAGASSQDHLNVTGTASLGGTLNLASYGTLSALPVGSTLILLNASSVSGAFQQVNESYNGIRLLPLYLSGAVELKSIIPSFQALGTTPNQRALGADLDGLALNPQMNSLMSSIGVLSPTDMQATYAQISPEDFTALYQAAFEGARARAALVDQRLSQLMEDVDNTAWLPGFSSAGTPWFAGNLPAKQEAAMTPHQASPWGGFVSGDGGFFNVSGDSNAAGYKVTTYGLTGAGADLRLSREAAAGLLVGYGHTDVTLGTGGTLSADGGQAGLYGLVYSDGFYAGALAEGGMNNYNTQRLGYGGVAKGSTQGSQYDGEAELGYQFKSGQVKIGPMAWAQYSSVSLKGFTEAGSQAPLTVPAQSADSLMSRLGIRAQSQWSLGSGSALNPSLELAWEHEYDFTGGTYQAGFGTGDSFTVAGPQVGQDGILAGAGVDISWSKSLTLSLNYQGEFGRTNLNSNRFGAGMRLGF